MKLETILTAMVIALQAHQDQVWGDKELYLRRGRQYNAFRDRIVRMFEERGDGMDWANSIIEQQAKRIAELEVALQKIVNANDIFYDPDDGKYFRELQEIARKELSDG